MYIVRIELRSGYIERVFDTFSEALRLLYQYYERASYAEIRKNGEKICSLI